MGDHLCLGTSFSPGALYLRFDAVNLGEMELETQKLQGAPAR